jgi:trans-2,3-dihydro-3-hydroxyanthranilate isomerase
MAHKFFITDVFAERRHAGNQLATFLDSEDLSDTEMQQFARETNFSETTFVLGTEEGAGGYDVRIFTPGEEVDFAGHPTLGTAYVIRDKIVRRPVQRIVLNLKVGPIPVDFPADGTEVLWMHQNTPQFGGTAEPETVAAALGLDRQDLDSRFPIEEVSTGLPQLMVPLRSMAALKRASISKHRYAAIAKGTKAKTVLLFCPEVYNPDEALAVRVFPIGVGIAEDPATGSGNGCLAGYLVKHRYFGADHIDIRVGQGYEIGRPSKLYLKAREEKKEIRVSVGGKVALVAAGEWF